ncbi:MAG: NUDIX hydrolase [Chloroflexota bacterium]
MTREHVAGGDPHPADDRLRETVISSRTVHRGHYLEVRVDAIATPDGGRSTRDVVAHPGAVAIVALDADDAVLMVRQFRLAAGRTLLEIPAGTLDRVDDGGVEDPDLAAPRELEEETGFRAGSWEHLGAFWTAPGFATELMHLYLARELVPAHENRLRPDEDERLELQRVPWREAVAMAERGEIADAKSLVGLLRLARIMDAAAPLIGPQGALMVTEETLAAAIGRAWPTGRNTPSNLVLSAASIMAALRTDP